MSSIDYVVKEYCSSKLSELQKHLNQWKNDFDLTIEAVKAIPDQEGYNVLVIIKRKRKIKYIMIENNEKFE